MGAVDKSGPCSRHYPAERAGAPPVRGKGVYSHPVGFVPLSTSLLPACTQRTQALWEEGVMPRKLTSRSTLENLKREAKRWLNALRSNAHDARARLDRVHPGAPA